MAMLRSAATDPMLDATRAFLENSYKFAALAAETRRNLIETHLKSLEHRLTAMHSAQSRMAGVADWASLQAAQAQTLTDQAVAQAALARAYGKVLVEATSAWLEQCRECGSDWVKRVETTNETARGNGNGNGAAVLDPLSASLAEFYERLGKMTPFGVVPPSESSTTATSATRSRAAKGGATS
ncbi:hypothetical protein ACUXAV_005614 [Cupriavidus metallidurans]|jgi:hypothetical protein|uniref:hypothetical protein n=1 Tax=Cupriavidus TaxID=106589 RepID=UPI0004930F23|nr:hypothetical protein [Cupriavidus metallidurans]AVA34256.1 hypothetical protein C3Z06_11960 [Cupriavidus metallidurans]KWW34884.1 hypothetical protein AU374_03758 [Cupriavidus metallidurans]MDE4922092.1 hypothetical protein [Cupriavidus metallidurans]